MDKRWLIGLGILLVGSFVYATQVFNDKVWIEFTDPNAFVVKEQFGPKVYFKVGTTTGSHNLSTTIEKTGAPGDALGTATNPWPLYTNEIHGQISTVKAGRGFTCDDLCDDTLDGTDYVSSNWSCIKSTNMDGSTTTCSSTTQERNCVCKN